MVAQRRDDRLAEGGEMRAAHRGVLAVHEGPVFLAVVVAVRDGDFDVFAFEVDDGIKRLAAEFLREQILQAVLRAERLAIQREREPAIQERVVPQHVLDELGAKFEVLAEERLVRRELHERAIALGGLGHARLRLELSFFKIHDLRFALADRLRAVV